jgi:hypothetical protein
LISVSSALRATLAASLAVALRSMPRSDTTGGLHLSDRLTDTDRTPSLDITGRITL